MADTERGTDPVTPQEQPGSSQDDTELLTMHREQLQLELKKTLAELADNLELRDGFLGQTGVHIGMSVLSSARRQFEQAEARLKERIALLEELLQKSP
ncbi:MAG: hypothetical protein HY672_00475 [Chloroflexi bacterium]|nr:hypothetical protein [Chloroflexota bacterium]